MRNSFYPALVAIAASACASDAPEAGGGAPMIVNAVNVSGEVGFREVHPGCPRAMWRAPGGALIDLGTLPGGRRSSAVAIDAAGTIVGQSETARGTFRAVRWHHGVIEDLGTLPGGDFSSATAIDGGAVFGESDAGDGVLHAFRWQDGRMTDLGRLSVPADGAPPPPRDRR